VSGIRDRLAAFEELSGEEDAAESRQDSQLIGRLSEKLLPSLFKLVNTLYDQQAIKVPENEGSPESLKSNDKFADASQIQAVTRAIASFAPLAPTPLVQSLFSKVIQRLLEAWQSDEDLSEKMYTLLTLSEALVVSEALDQPSISLLYRSLKPLIRTDETKPRVQKRAYKVLAEVCHRYPAFVKEKKTVTELLDFLTSSTATSQTAARSMRIKCLNHIVNAFAGSHEMDKVRRR
jgi:ribosomal RNA-processing protein 12